MALLKSKTLPNGAIGNYWKIMEVRVDKLTMVASFSIELYADQTHADAKSPTLGLQKNYSKLCTSDELKGDLVALGYEHIKASVTPYEVNSVMIHPDEDLESASDA